MRHYRRIIAFIDIGPEAATTSQRAIQMARLHGAALALAGVVDFVPGYECDRYPVVSGDEMRLAIRADVQRQLDKLLKDASASGEVIVACGGVGEVVTRTLASWRPDLVIVGRRSRLPLDPGVVAGGYDILTVGDPGWKGIAGRMIQALASAL